MGQDAVARDSRRSLIGKAKKIEKCPRKASARFTLKKKGTLVNRQLHL